MQVLVRDNNVDQALKALKKKMQREGIFREMKLRGHYEKPSEKRAREKAEAVRRARKLARKKMQREGLIPMKPKPVFGAPGGGAGARRRRTRRSGRVAVRDAAAAVSAAAADSAAARFGSSKLFGGFPRRGRGSIPGPRCRFPSPGLLYRRTFAAFLGCKVADDSRDRQDAHDA